MSLTIEITRKDLASPAVEKISAGLTGDDVKQAMGAGLRVFLINYFTKLEQDNIHHRTSERLRTTRSGFFAKAASQVQSPEVRSDGVVVGIAGPTGLAQRYFGGKITAKNSKWLTIPAEAVGQSARKFNNLHFVYFNSNLAALKENLATLIKRGRNGVYRPGRFDDRRCHLLVEARSGSSARSNCAAERRRDDRCGHHGRQRIPRSRLGKADWAGRKLTCLAKIKF